MEDMPEVPLEVERKFLIPEDIKSRLDSLKATLVKEVSYTDIYLDTTDNTLALSDMWLRRRNGVYQLKYAPSVRVESAVLQYQETDDKKLIQELVSARISECNDSEATPTRELDLDKLIPFAEINTHRTEYKIGENIVIDLDDTDLGYCIGEVEVISLTSDTVQQSVNEVNRIISELGVQTVGTLGGKIMQYLKKFNPSLLDRIRVKLNF